MKCQWHQIVYVTISQSDFSQNVQVKHRNNLAETLNHKLEKIAQVHLLKMAEGSVSFSEHISEPQERNMKDYSFTMFKECMSD